MESYLISPEDLLFFRDARPMASGEGYGYGCNMPLPEQLHKALRTALLRQSGQLPGKKSVSKHTKDGKSAKKIGADKFGSLQCLGPFPYQKDRGVLFSIPNDVRYRNLKTSGKSIFKTELKTYNIPGDKKSWYPEALPVSTIPSTKDKASGFWTQRQMAAYIKGEECDFTPVPPSEIWKDEWRIGVEINPDTNSSKEGQLYASSYMRMSEGTAFAASISIHEKDVLDKIQRFQFGGERRLVKIEKKEGIIPEFKIDIDIKKGGPCILKWVLLTPAVFSGGSIPGWCIDSQLGRPPGRVCLKIDGKAHLIACSTDSPMPFSGWDLLEGTAKPTLYAVRPGAVYYFWCESTEVAEKLYGKINCKARSDMLAETGCGYGICAFDETNLNIDIN